MSNATTQIVQVPSIDDLIADENVGIPDSSIISSNSSQQIAIREQNSISDKSLDEQARESDHQRSENWKNHCSKAFIRTFWVFWTFFIIMSAVLIYHWLTPDTWHWLSDVQLDHLKTIVIAVLASSAVSSQHSKIK